MLDLTDGNIGVGLRSLAEMQLDWILLGYNYATDHTAIALLGSGSGGIPEMKRLLEDAIFFAFCRGEYAPGDERFAQVIYLPRNTEPERKAAAFAHARQIHNLFKVPHGVVVIRGLENVTPGLLKDAFAKPDPYIYAPEETMHISQPSTPGTSPYAISHAERLARSAFFEPPLPPTPAPTPGKAGRVKSLFMRRKKRTSMDGPLPPLPPSKQEYTLPSPPHDYTHARSRTEDWTDDGTGRTRRPSSGISRYSSDDVVVLDHGQTSPLPEPPQLPSSGKWAPSLPRAALSPEEKARARAEAQRKREEEEQAAVLEEAERQARIKFAKREQARLEQEAAVQRKIKLEAELKQMSIDRARKEKEAQLAEERRLAEVQERKRQEKERRVDESRRAEEWRKEQARIAEQAARDRERSRKSAEQARNSKIKMVAVQIQGEERNADVTGWVSISVDSLVWKRRYFKFVGSTMFLYRNPQEMNKILDKVQFAGRVRGLREWNEGYEELEAIPHSFAVEWTDIEPWSMYTDSEDAKVHVLALLFQAAGL